MRLPADPSNVGVARQVVAESAKALGMDDARLADLKLAVSEACTNAVTHAYGDGAGHHFRLSVEVDDTLLPGEKPRVINEPAGSGWALRSPNVFPSSSRQAQVTPSIQRCRAQRSA